MDDELTALAAIYGDAFFADAAAACYGVRLTAAVEFVFWADGAAYPATAAPEFAVRLAPGAAWRSRAAPGELRAALLALFAPGDVCVFAWLEHLHEHADDYVAAAAAAPADGGGGGGEVQDNDCARKRFDIRIYSGEVLLDRKSRFQAHIARASCLDEVDWVVQQVKSFPKSAHATHQMVAYRFSRGDSNRDDDGEGGAGDRMLHLLEKMNQVDIVAVVTRWYGGIQLGPDRFKDITGVLKKLIESTPEFCR